MKYIITLAFSLGLFSASAQTYLDPNVGINTHTPSFYQHGGASNLGMEIYNPGTGPSSQAHVMLSTGATTGLGSIGTLSWATHNSSQTQLAGWVSMLMDADATTAPFTEMQFATANGGLPQVQMKLSPLGYLGIGVSTLGVTRAPLDVMTPVTNTTTSILGRLPEGDNIGSGTYLGIATYNTNVLNAPSFALEHRFYGRLNSAINFNRGGDMLNGFITFATNDGTEKMRLDQFGNLAVGTSKSTNYRLTVEGTIAARKVKVTQEAWADYVFEKSYELPSLQEVENYVTVNKHLPDVPSAAEVAKDGIDVGEMDKVLIKKVEELTLYMIKLEKENAELKARLEKVEAATQKK
jgi:hypothetical protein